VVPIQLPEVEADHLEQAFRSATDRKFQDRLPIVLRAHRGRPHRDIAADLAVSPRTFHRWLNAYPASPYSERRCRDDRKSNPAIDSPVERTRGAIPAAFPQVDLKSTITRPVKSVGGNVRLDRAPWTLAERLAEAVF
jgi:hypothetical protein